MAGTFVPVDNIPREFLMYPDTDPGTPPYIIFSNAQGTVPYLPFTEPLCVDLDPIAVGGMSLAINGFALVISVWDAGDGFDSNNPLHNRNNIAEIPKEKYKFEDSGIITFPTSAGSGKILCVSGGFVPPDGYVWEQAPAVGAGIWRWNSGTSIDLKAEFGLRAKPIAWLFGNQASASGSWTLNDGDSGRTDIITNWTVGMADGVVTGVYSGSGTDYANLRNMWFLLPEAEPTPFMLGDKPVSKIMFGGDEISAAYLGTKLIYQTGKETGRA